ncbi:MAG: phage tail sheath C-terminal domain-containing protein [Caulobacteraceae bacterium]
MAMNTPGVYIKEVNAFPNSIVEVATAVPAFIGYTQIASNRGQPLKGKPFRISSMAEFITYFGGAPGTTSPGTAAGAAPSVAVSFTISEVPTGANPPDADFSIGGKQYYLKQKSGRYLLYYGMMHFFQNGGGPCYIVSVGDYTDPVSAPDLMSGINALQSEREPTMVVIPEAILLGAAADCYSVQEQMLLHCATMQNRFAILDIYRGDCDRKDPGGDPIEAFRDGVSNLNLNFGAAYYPALQTTIVQDRDATYQNVDSGGVSLASLITTELQLTLPPGGSPNAQQTAMLTAIDALPANMTPLQLDQSLRSISPLYVLITAAIARQLNVLPPSTAMAGLYTLVDNSRGVWKAPANIGVNSVVAPAVKISDADQEDLNVTPMGKSINAIRSFIGEGVLVWGARTLDGNSLDWRYINVRRTLIMLEESCRLAAKAMVFEPNVADTWLTIKSMVGNFLTSVWKRGGLTGAVPQDAFAVFCGLGETMTADDLLEGILRVTVLVAVSRPAEFIEITFQQQLQKS